MKKGSVGNVETKTYALPNELVLKSGKTLKEVNIAYETYGKLNKDKNNAILVFHALSGNAHAAGIHKTDGKLGWWDALIGPLKCIDTNKYFVICSNVLGGCNGTTGPSSINPDTNKPYGIDFPVITISDMVTLQKNLIDHLGIKKLFSIIGGSMGGMQALEWCATYPEVINSAVIIATTSSSSPQQIAFNEIGRRAIMSDPKWDGGKYYYKNQPSEGLALARMIGHVTYLSKDSMHEKFGRCLQDKNEYGFNFETDFQVESYLKYQGDSFTKRFDANSYLYLTKALDYFDLTKNGSLSDAFEKLSAKIMIVSINSDWLYTPEEAKEIVSAMSTSGINVKYHEIKSIYGHDAFLIENGQMSYIISEFLSEKIVENIMTKNFSTIYENETIKKAASLMVSKNITHIPVVSNENKLLGIITAWDVSKSIAEENSIENIKISQMMTKNVITAFIDDKIEKIAIKMQEYNISCLPVVDQNGLVIGMISAENITNTITI
ncbi:homoserine O-acetyltransferase [Methanococcus vannielii SB]|jgi:homoserine O-acetyltransferase|uniref:Homoserine O-acetyltransferase n=1 Tax=Methanococcus vannielii (strain ATCC 35089 / DSM 1224 / JCM 13029 / OCM 148 / SB) TaxID=406327 RepID=METXA_METVS|nr:homoserine O-acetyltransferase [Methanococcus vannielii]A6UNL1.1 RecName: Full=Homoserine O-acetyltransferase; Short=HAT; AltName: Full=Homoserine transacetylase; Short=HTA [Methanococcus vannielii SB]ABR54083.1 homoserine O-acetyltransferase [Methanococcus vannielii SB]